MVSKSQKVKTMKKKIEPPPDKMCPWCGSSDLWQVYRLDSKYGIIYHIQFFECKNCKKYCYRFVSNEKKYAMIPANNLYDAKVEGRKAMELFELALELQKVQTA